MELDNLKEIWKDLGAKKTPNEEILSMLQKKSQRPIAKMKRNLLAEMIAVIVLYSACTVYYLIAWGGRYWELSLMFLLVGAFCIFYYYRKYKLLNSMECVVCEVKSNLQRQLLFDEEDARQSFPKAQAAARKIAAINSEVGVEPCVKDLTPQTVSLIENIDLILDCTDNFETRYLINDFAVKSRMPWIYAAAVGSYAVTMNILPGETACLACMFPEPPRGTAVTCETAGILNSAANLVASLQVTEALKLMISARGALRTSLLSIDLWTGERSEISSAKPRPDCSVCSERRFDYLEGKARPQITLCGRNSVQIHERERPVDFSEMSSRLSPHGQVRYNEMVLKFWREAYEMTLFRDGRAIIKGTTDPIVARSLYAKYVGS